MSDESQPEPARSECERVACELLLEMCKGLGIPEDVAKQIEFRPAQIGYIRPIVADQSAKVLTHEQVERARKLVKADAGVVSDDDWMDEAFCLLAEIAGE